MANFFSLSLSAVVSVNAASLEPKKTLVEADQSAESHTIDFRSSFPLRVCFARSSWVYVGLCGVASLRWPDPEQWDRECPERARPAVKAPECVKSPIFGFAKSLAGSWQQTDFLDAKCEKVFSLRPLARRSSPLSADCKSLCKSANWLQICTVCFVICFAIATNDASLDRVSAKFFLRQQSDTQFAIPIVSLVQFKFEFKFKSSISVLIC